MWVRGQLFSLYRFVKLPSRCDGCNICTNWSTGNWSCAPSCVGRHEFREFSIQSIANSKPNWAVTAPGRAGSAGLRASAVRGSARTDAGVELEVEDRAQFMRKKKVALWVGYVGTDYKGNS